MVCAAGRNPCHAAQVLLNRPDNIVALHAVTTAQASLEAFFAIRDERRRCVVLLQAASRAAFYQGYATAFAERQRLDLSKADPASI